jgi:hypothetical protein
LCHGITSIPPFLERCFYTFYGGLHGTLKFSDSGLASPTSSDRQA